MSSGLKPCALPPDVSIDRPACAATTASAASCALALTVSVQRSIASLGSSCIARLCISSNVSAIASFQCFVFSMKSVVAGLTKFSIESMPTPGILFKPAMSTFTLASALFINISMLRLTDKNMRFTANARPSNPTSSPLTMTCIPRTPLAITPTAFTVPPSAFSAICPNPPNSAARFTTSSSAAATAGANTTVNRCAALSAIPAILPMAAFAC